MGNENPQESTSSTTAEEKLRESAPLRKTVLMERERELPPGNENVRVIDLYGLPLSFNLTFVQFLKFPELKEVNDLMAEMTPQSTPWQEVPSGAAYTGSINEPNLMSGRCFRGILLCCQPPQHHPEWYATIAHEAIHIAKDLMMARDISHEAEEFRAWLSDWIVQSHLKYFMPVLHEPTTTESVMTATPS